MSNDSNVDKGININTFHSETVERVCVGSLSVKNNVPYDLVHNIKDCDGDDMEP